jgi:hypothetical protein
MQNKIHRPPHEHIVAELAPLMLRWLLTVNRLSRLRRQRTGTTRKERRAA